MKILQYTNENKEDLLKKGIYLISNLEETKFYVGSTTRSFKERFRKHLSDLNLKKHCNTKLSNFVNKYGVKSIKFLILDVVEDAFSLSTEQYWINLLNPYFNIAKVAGRTTGYKHTKEYINRRSNSILQYDQNGNFLKKWDSKTQIFKSLGFDKNVIKECCYHKRFNICGYTWRHYEENFPKTIDIIDSKHKIKFICYSKEGKFLKVYNSILDFSLEYGINTGNISRAIQKNSYINDFILKKYTKNYPLHITPHKKNKTQKKIKVIKNNIETIYHSLREAGKNGINREYVSLKLKEGQFKFFHKKYGEVELID